MKAVSENFILFKNHKSQNRLAIPVDTDLEAFAENFRKILKNMKNLKYQKMIFETETD